MFFIRAVCLVAAGSWACQAGAGIQVLETRVVSPQPGYYHGWPTVAADASGGLFLVYSGGRDYHVCPFGRVELMTSRDGGRTWAWPRVVLDSATDDRDAGVLATPGGALLVTSFTSLAYQDHLRDPARLLKKTFGDELDTHLARWRSADARYAQAAKERDVGMWFIRSGDGGKTWSDRYAAPCNSPHGPVALRDGRLLYAGKELWTEEKKVGVWLSADDGLTWKRAAWLEPRPGETVTDYHELSAIEAADGTLIVQIRNHNGGRRETLQCESHDGGATWTLPRAIGVDGFPSHLVRLKDGRLVMTYGWREAPRGIRGRVSADHGRTWSEEFVLTDDAPGWDVGYPGTVELADGQLLTVWYEVMADSPKAVLRQARWSLE
ncbi:hypothetical protein OPIT5_23725 [Opitutaceae bacterium TAV5]|nr:hypothetical protein OPIT5_23725 [Opitutaceae bacterium TAV5]